MPFHTRISVAPGQGRVCGLLAWGHCSAWARFVVPRHRFGQIWAKWPEILHFGRARGLMWALAMDSHKNSGLMFEREVKGIGRT